MGELIKLHLERYPLFKSFFEFGSPISKIIRKEETSSNLSLNNYSFEFPIELNLHNKSLAISVLSLLYANSFTENITQGGIGSSSHIFQVREFSLVEIEVVDLIKKLGLETNIEYDSTGLEVKFTDGSSFSLSTDLNTFDDELSDVYIHLLRWVHRDDFHNLMIEKINEMRGGNQNYENYETFYNEIKSYDGVDPILCCLKRLFQSKILITIYIPKEHSSFCNSILPVETDFYRSLWISRNLITHFNDQHKININFYKKNSYIDNIDDLLNKCRVYLS